jgi:hypothetical protein
LNLPQRLLAIHSGLDALRIPHAFGGAIALAYWTREPRGTRDLDVNIFIPPEECEAALAALPDGVAYGEIDVKAIKRDGQRRLAWDDTPLDLFFSSLPIHHEAERNQRQVPFEGEEIPILGALALGVFKVMFDRTRDWADIESMLEAGTLDVDALREQVAELAGDGDPRLARLDETVRRTRPA